MRVSAVRLKDAITDGRLDRDEFSIEEINEVLDYHVGVLNLAITCGDLKAYTCGERTIILKEDVLAFLDSTCNQLDTYEKNRGYMLHHPGDEFSVENNTVH